MGSAYNVIPMAVVFKLPSDYFSGNLKGSDFSESAEHPRSKRKASQVGYPKSLVTFGFHDP